MENSSGKEWFENWFDTPFYHSLYKERDDNEAHGFIDNLFSQQNLKTGAKVLDIACGKGRHSIYMASKGFDVTGIDLAENSIDHARKFESTNLSFFRHDMRDVFRVNYFDCAVNLFTSLGYFKNESDNQKVIQAAAVNLKKEGLLVVDFFNAACVKALLQSNFEKCSDGIDFHITKEIENRRVNKTIRFESEGRNYQFQESVSLLTLSDFETMFEIAGLKMYAVFGSYQLEEFNVASSPRLIMLGRKA